VQKLADRKLKSAQKINRLKLAQQINKLKLAQQINVQPFLSFTDSFHDNFRHSARNLEMIFAKMSNIKFSFQPY
jgi:hypothetical protein